MTNMYFQVASFFYMVMILVLFFSKKRVNNKETKLFSILSIINIIGIILDIIIVFLSYVKPGILALYILNKFYLLYIVYWVSLFCIYIGNLSMKSNKIQEKLKKIIIVLNIICTIIVLIVPIYLFNKDNIMYTYGPSVTVTYITVAISVFFMIGMVIGNIKQIISKKYSPIIILMVLSFMGLVVRKINPALLLTTSIITFINVLMYHTIENPDMKMIEELELAKNQAVKANNAKTDFLSSMSHEIRTPLNAIVGFSECVASANTLEEAKENSADIISASRTLLEIVNGILDISKIESGKLEIVNSKYNAKDLLEEVATLVRPRIEDKNINFEISISDDIPDCLYGDHTNLRKIITNLLSNAAKYTEHGYVKYEVKCINNNNICRLIISVEDSGRGIKEENMKKLFTKFQRLDEDKNTTIEGTGLGLAITKKLLELMGGTIVVQSKYNEGSKFTAIVDQKIEIETKNEKTVEKVISNNIDVSNRNVLLVDDNTLNLKVASKLLEKYHLNIETLDNGFSCIEKIKSGANYDLILMDDMMPKMSGVETLNELKKINGFCTPVVALTANAISGMKEKYISLGFNDYLAKPINKNELETVIYKYLNPSYVEKKVDFGELPEEIYEIGNKGGLIVPGNKDNKTSEEYLKENEIDYEKGIELLGDLSMYQETMKDFLENIDERVSKLEHYKDDMKNYAIEAHALKSDSKYLGFTTLAELSYSHELKSKENDTDYINDHFQELITEVNRIIKVSKEYIKKLSSIQDVDS